MLVEKWLRMIFLSEANGVLELTGLILDLLAAGITGGEDC